jgi:hypothetical protein
MQTHTVEVWVQVRSVPDGAGFVGTYQLRAFTVDGCLLREVTHVLADLAVSTSDYARLLTLEAALTRLHLKLRAAYALQLVQSSHNFVRVERGWTCVLPLFLFTVTG